MWKELKTRDSDYVRTYDPHRLLYPLAVTRARADYVPQAGERQSDPNATVR